jgi:amino acid transporter
MGAKRVKKVAKTIGFAQFCALYGGLQACLSWFYEDLQVNFFLRIRAQSLRL